MKYASRSIDCGYVTSMAVAHGREEALVYMTKEDNFGRSLNLFHEEEQKLDPVHPALAGVVATSMLLRGVDPIAVSGSRDGTVNLWDQRDSRFLRKIKPRDGVVLSMAVFLDRKMRSLIMIGYGDGAVVFWDLGTDKVHMTAEDHYGWVTDVCMASHASRMVAVSAGSDGVVYSWNLDTKKKIHRLQHDSIVMSVAVACRDIAPVIATGCVDTIVRVWDEETGVLLRILDRHFDSVLSLTFWEGNEILLISGSADTSIRVWDILSGECVVTLLAHNDFVTKVAISRLPIPSIISTSSDGTLRIWDLASIVEDYYRSNILCIVYGIGKRNDRAAHDAAVTSAASNKHSSFVKDMVRNNNFSMRLSGNQPIIIRKDGNDDENNIIARPPKPRNTIIEQPINNPPPRGAASASVAPAAVAPAAPSHKPPAVAAPKVSNKKGAKKGRVSPDDSNNAQSAQAVPVQPQAASTSASTSASALVQTYTAAPPAQAQAPAQPDKHSKELQEKMDMVARQKKIAQATSLAESSTNGGRVKANQNLTNRLSARGVAPPSIVSNKASVGADSRLTKAIISESEVQDERRKQSILRVKEQAAEKLQQRLGGRGKAGEQVRDAAPTNGNASAMSRQTEEEEEEESSDGEEGESSDGEEEESSDGEEGESEESSGEEEESEDEAD